RSARPKWWRPPEALSRCVGALRENDVQRIGGRVSHFSGKYAVVTGGGSGIGAALVRALVAAGADVLCTDVDGDEIGRTAAAATGAGTADAAQLDVTDAGAV